MLARGVFSLENTPDDLVGPSLDAVGSCRDVDCDSLRSLSVSYDASWDLSYSPVTYGAGEKTRSRLAPLECEDGPRLSDLKRGVGGGVRRSTTLTLVRMGTCGGGVASSVSTSLASLVGHMDLPLTRLCPAIGFPQV